MKQEFKAQIQNLTNQLKFNQAHDLLNKALEQTPNALHLLELKVDVLEKQEAHFELLPVLTTLISLQPEQQHWRYKKALVATKAGKIELAERLFAQCDATRFPFLALNLGHIYKAKGLSANAAECYLAFIADNAEQVGVGYWSLADLKDFTFTKQLIAQMELLLENEKLSIGNQALLQFALGRAYEQAKNFALSFERMAKANQIMAQYRPFHRELFVQLIRNQVGCSQLPNRTSNEKVTPIFIVGMPRSGTTLTEQILSAHSLVESTDELPFIERIALSLEGPLGYAKNLSGLEEPQLTSLAESYLQQVDHYFERTPKYFIDKNPNNFLHIGLIKSLFPNAKIINVVRSPLDNAMGVYKQYFSAGHNYSYSLADIAFYWQGYLTLMQHWSALYGDDIYHLSYEGLVKENQYEITQLLNYCGLEIEPECFTFYKSKRAVLTPSVSQVRQPINNKAVGSWKRFQLQLEPYLTEFQQIEQKVDSLLKS